MNDFKHFILTRFAVKVGFTSPSRHTDARWLAERLELFTEFTLPSIKAQTCQDFTWLLLVSSEAPNEPIDQLQSILREHLPGRAEIAVLKGNRLASSVKSRAPACSEPRILTSRLDNDDAVHVDYVKEIQQACAADPGRFFLEFDHGYSYNRPNHELRYYENDCNAFAHLIEPNREDLTTVFCGNHRFLKNQGPSKTLGGYRWMQVVHGGNHMNLHRGEAVMNLEEKAQILRDFGLPHLVPHA